MAKDTFWQKHRINQSQQEPTGAGKIQTAHRTRGLAHREAQVRAAREAENLTRKYGILEPIGGSTDPELARRRQVAENALERQRQESIRRAKKS